MEQTYDSPFFPTRYREPRSASYRPSPEKTGTLAARKLADVDYLDARLLQLFVDAATTAAPAVEQLDIERRFLAYAQKWEQETASMSSVTKRVLNPNYQAIVGMGQLILPILLRDLQRNRRDWFWALSAITQENPVDHADAGRVDKMISAWVSWGKKKGLL